MIEFIGKEGVAGHRGSASANLSGRAVLAVWLLSMVLHGALLTVLLLVPFSFGGNQTSPLPELKTDIIGPIDPAPLPPPTTPNLTKTPIATETPRVEIKPKPYADLTELTSTKKPDLSIIGIGTGGSDWGAMGLQAGSAPGPEFFGVGASVKGAQKIAYVVDRSASMIDTFPYVQAELKRSVSALRRSQQFHVIFFNSGPPLESPPQRLVYAVAAHKDQFFEFLNEVSPRGGTKPEAAMVRALALKPDLIYLLSDGIDFDPEILRRLDEWNRDRRVRICTIAYLDPGGRQILEQIAREHNGEFTFVSEHNLP